jgi:DNA-binding transcriptional ArsR family regulator
MKNIVRTQPNWLFETITLLSQGFLDREGYPMDFITDPASYNMTREEIGERLGATVSFLKTIYKETRKILREYTDLEPYFHKRNFGSVALVSLGIDSAKKLKVEDYKKALYYHALLEMIEVDEDEEKIDFNSEANIANMFEALSKTSWNDSDKMQLMTLFQVADQSFERISEMFCRVEDVLRRNYGLIKDKYESVVSKYSADNGQESQAALRRHINQIESIGAAEVIFQVSVVSLNALHLISPFYDREIVHAIMGIDFELLTDLKQEADKIEEQPLIWMKALADGNKLKIIRLLTQRPMFLREISDELGVSGATTSHHIKQMIEAKLLKFQISGRKVFYKINAEEFESMASLLLKIAEMSKEQEKCETRKDSENGEMPSERQASGNGDQIGKRILL